MTYFRFPTAELVSHLTENEETYKGRDIPNSSYTTFGYLVPRSSVVQLAEQFHFIVSVEGGSWTAR